MIQIERDRSSMRPPILSLSSGGTTESVFSDTTSMVEAVDFAFDSEIATSRPYRRAQSDTMSYITSAISTIQTEQTSLSAQCPCGPALSYLPGQPLGQLSRSGGMWAGWHEMCKELPGNYVWGPLKFPEKLGVLCKHDTDICKPCLQKYLTIQVNEYGVGAYERLDLHTPILRPSLYRGASVYTRARKQFAPSGITHLRLPTFLTIDAGPE